MKHCLRKSTVCICHTKPINVLVWYVIIACYMHISPNNAKAPALIVFGDSIVDSGNNDYIDTIGRANFPPYGRDFDGGVATGRYSNGKIPSDFLAELMGIKKLVPPYLDPKLQIKDLLTGVSFASGGSGYDPQSAKLANAITLEKQLKMFKEYINKLKAAVGDNMTNTIISESVYLVCAGSNDITNTYFTLPFRQLEYNVSEYTSLLVNFSSTFVQKIYDLGARKIGVISAPPCGCLPSQRTLHGGVARVCVEKENKASILYNNKLNSELNSLNQRLTGSNVVYLDIYNSVLNLINNPSQSGFRVANRGCCGTGNLEVSFLCTKFGIGTCKNASEFIFWDSFHPTEATYRIIVQDIVQKNVNLFFGEKSEDIMIYTSHNNKEYKQIIL